MRIGKRVTIRCYHVRGLHVEGGPLHGEIVNLIDSSGILVPV